MDYIDTLRAELEHTQRKLSEADGCRVRFLQRQERMIQRDIVRNIEKLRKQEHS